MIAMFLLFKQNSMSTKKTRDNALAKEEVIEMEGVVTEALPNTTFRV